MLSHELVIDGTAYIRSREAARVVGLSSDYLTKLGRGSVIDGKLVTRVADLEEEVFGRPRS